jgi:serine/threonine protein kinase
LVSLVEASPKRRLAETTARRVFKDVVAGLVHCHAAGVWHMDVKPDNVLMAGGSARVTDFGSASTARLTCQPCGTLEYACPEALAAGVSTPSPSTASSVACSRSSSRCGSPTPGGAGASAPPGSGCGGVAFRMADPVRVTLDADKADVWALGVSMVTCLTGSYPWGCARSSDPVYDAWCDAWDRLLVASSMRTHSSSGSPAVPVVSSTCCTPTSTSSPAATAAFASPLSAPSTAPTSLFARFSRKAARSVSPQPSVDLGVEPLVPLCAGLAGSGKLCRDGVTALGLNLLTRCGRAEVTVALSPLLLDLLVRMLDPRPHMRLSMEEVAAHPWMASDASAGAPGSSAVLGARAPAKALGAATGGGKGGSGSRTALPTLLSTRKPTSVREAW